MFCQPLLGTTGLALAGHRQKARKRDITSDNGGKNWRYERHGTSGDVRQDLRFAGVGQETQELRDERPYYVILRVVNVLI
jgi:hypothetical protein